MRALVLLGALLMLHSAAPRAQEIGSGDLWLHEGVMRYYRDFDRNPAAAFFAVSTNGFAAGYSYCPSVGDCQPLEGKLEALQSCRSVDPDLPGECFIFANDSRILWQGPVHVVTEEDFMARLYGPTTIEQALEPYTEHVEGPGKGAVPAFALSAEVWTRNDFRFPPAEFVLRGDECRYAFDSLYMTSRARNFFLADASGRYCGFATGYAQSEEAAAFRSAAAACAALAPDAGPCLVYAAGGEMLTGRRKL
jgi:hypothetical protein